MDTKDELAQVKAQVDQLNDQIQEARSQLNDLQARHDKLASDAGDLAAFIAWKQAQP